MALSSSGERLLGTNGGVIRLNIGSGTHRLDGFLNVDIDLRVRPDVAATTNQLPFPTGSVGKLIAYHVIEHVQQWEVLPTLREWFRVLAPGGQISIECPDLRKVVHYLATEDDYSPVSQFGMWGLYGDPAHRNPFYGHHWGFTPETLSAALIHAGFVQPTTQRALTHQPERDLRVEATKPTVTDHPLWDDRDHAPTAWPRIFWLLYGSYTVASSRIQGYRLHAYLKARGWTSDILLQPESSVIDTPLRICDFQALSLLRPGDIVIFQKLEGPNTTALLEWMAGSGVTTVYLDADLPLKLREASTALWTVCSSAAQAIAYRQAGIRTAVYLPEAVESTRPPRTESTPGARLRGVWFGSWTPAKAEDIAFLRRLLKDHHFDDIDLIVISNHPSADIQWNINTIFDELHACDFALLPVTQDDAHSLGKSTNRAVQAMALGLPVLASPLSAYVEVIDHGWNGYLCASEEAWVEALRQIQDTHTRTLLATNAHRLAQLFFSIEPVGALWTQFLMHLPGHSPAPSPPLTRFKRARLRARTASRLISVTHDRPLKLRYLSQALRAWPFDHQLWAQVVSSASRLPSWLIAHVTRRFRHALSK